MQYLILVITILIMSSQNVLMKQYNVKSKSQNSFLFSAVSALFAMLFFIISSGSGLQFTSEFLPYSIGFAAAYAAALVGQNYAIATGSLSISSLVSSYSLIIPTLYGILFLKESLKPSAYIGIVLLFVSLYFINIKKESARFSAKWVICLIISFIGNGMCSTVQKMQQLKCNGAYKNEFMIAALGIVFVILTVIVLASKADIKTQLKECRLYAPLTGIANGATNLLVMVLTALLPTAVLFPSISAGGIIIMFVISLFVYKEKISRQQMVGYIMGVVSVVLLNL